MKRDAMWSLIKEVDGVATLCFGQEDWLYDKACAVRPESNILEIGSYRGRSTRCLCAGAEESKATVVSVSTFWCDEDKARFETNMADCISSGLLRHVHEDSATALVRMVRQGFKSSLIFVDGDHEYYQASLDILNSLFIVEPGGMIAIHDYVDPFSGVMRACDEFASRLGTLERCGSIFAGRIQAVCQPPPA